MLVLSNVVFAAGLGGLASADGPASLFLAWAAVGVGMGMGLYEAAFATLAGIYGQAARSPITGITLIAGFASTVGWPLSGRMLSEWGWREACLGWAALHLALALPLNLSLPPASPFSRAPSEPTKPEGTGSPPRLASALLAFVFSARIAAACRPIAAVDLILLGGPAATAFAVTHGGGNGILTIAKGTLPLALFGTAG